MEFIKKHFWKITSLVLTLLLLLKCGNNTTNPNYVIIPEKKGSFEIDKPTEIKDSIVYRYRTLKGDTIELENPINLELAKLYQLEKDSLKRELLYYKSIQNRTYIDSVKDKNVKISYVAKTTGTLDNIKFNYIVFKDSVKVRLPEKKTVFALYTGGGLYLKNNFDLGYKLDVKFQNKKGDLFGGSYDPINKVIFAEYNFRLINIKK